MIVQKKEKERENVTFTKVCNSSMQNILAVGTEAMREELQYVLLPQRAEQLHGHRKASLISTSILILLMTEVLAKSSRRRENILKET